MNTRALLPPDTLRDVRLAVSASPSPDFSALGLLNSHFHLALGEIARTVLVLGGGLLYGGHLEPEGLTALLVNEVKRYGRRSSTGGSLHVVLPWVVHRMATLTRIGAMDRELGIRGEVTCLDRTGQPMPRDADRTEEPPGITVADAAPSLTAMRTATARRTQGRIVIGGKRTGYLGAMPGVMEEALVSIRLSQPLYLAGGFGGVTLDLARLVDPVAGAWLPTALGASVDGADDVGYQRACDDVTTALSGRGWTALANGLDADENVRLATTYRPSEIATLVSLGLGRLVQQGQFAEPRVRDG